MNNKKECKTINDYLNLWEKYHKEGNKQKARECLEKISHLQDERWKYEKSEMIKLCEKVGITFDDLQKE